MDPKVLLLLLCVTISSVQGFIPKCCVTTSRVSFSQLQEVDKFDVQNRQGACNIDALVLHHKGKKYCAHPRVKKILQFIQQRKLGSRHTAV